MHCVLSPKRMVAARHLDQGGGHLEMIAWTSIAIVHWDWRAKARYVHLRVYAPVKEI